jgi:hypothetical protein
MRQVLEPQEQNAAAKGDTNDGHSKSIKSVLNALEIKEGHPVAMLWLSLPSQHPLQQKRHRHALFEPRPVDRGFLEFWDQFQTVLDFVLERFEGHYLRYHEILDALAALPNPIPTDVKRLKERVPNNIVAYRYFFERLSSPGWLIPLLQEGFFSYPPPVEIEGELARPVAWPQAHYLTRMELISKVVEIR